MWGTTKFRAVARRNMGEYGGGRCILPVNRK
jgi:hypothetical protein